MLQVRNLSNVLQKRLIRPLYAHTQATPYASVLDATLRNTDGSFRAPLSGELVGSVAGGPTRAGNAFTLQGGLVPGTVMVKTVGEAMSVHPGGSTAVQPFGLLANFVGGTLDDLRDNNEIGVWRGPDSVFELLTPAWDDTGLAALYAGAVSGTPVLLAPGNDGRLVGFANAAGLGARIAAARLIERASASKIVVELVI
jgi:hypothetical protein